MYSYYLYWFILAGHLTFQCYNGAQNALPELVEEDSTSSDSEVELRQLEALLAEKKKKDEACSYFF